MNMIFFLDFSALVFDYTQQAHIAIIVLHWNYLHNVADRVVTQIIQILTALQIIVMFALLVLLPNLKTEMS